MTHRNRLMACVIKQYGTGIYRAWVSLDKGHTVCLGSHQDEADATETIDRFWETYQDGLIKAPEDLLSYASSICGQELAAPPSMIGQSAGEMAA
jgi:hypothetical protein